MQRFSFLIVILVFCVFPAFAQTTLPAPTITTFADDTFADADWSAAQAPGLQLVSSLKGMHTALGGHPNDHWKVEGVLPSRTIAGSKFVIVNLMKGYTFDPAKDGAVLKIDGACDLRSRSVASVALLLLQDGTHFIANLPSGASNGNWLTANRAALKATDFVRLTPAQRNSPAPQSPDFSCSGKPFQLGFATTLTKGTGNEFAVAIDNWSLRITSACCAPPAQNDRRARRTRCCDDQEAKVDANGTVILPDDVDLSIAPVFEYVDQEVGDVKDLYSGVDTSTDTWYASYPCKPSCGTTLPQQAVNPPNLGVALQDAGVKDVSPDSMRSQIEEWEKKFAEADLSKPPDWSKRAAPKFNPPKPPYAPRPAHQYAFGGRDIIFVHGLKLEHLVDKFHGEEDAQTLWKEPAEFPADKLNPEFYTGYFKDRATLTWAGSINPKNDGGHVREFLHGGFDGTKTKYMNRYLVVSYSCAERLEVAVKSILAQIGDAMVSGIGVVDPLDLNGPPPKNFGTPSFVIISHSTGGEVVDVALTAAAQYPSLGAEYIPKLCKAHISVQGAHTGSRYASTAIALAGFIQTNPANHWDWYLAKNIFSGVAPGLAFENASLFAGAANSILMDLSPIIAQQKWGRYVREVPVRTLTVVAAHPTFLYPFKNVLLHGLDDGVLTVESQLANPNDIRFAPSGFATTPINLAKNFDLGVFGQSDTITASANGILAKYSITFTANAINAPSRALNYYVNQKADRMLNPNNVSTFPPFFFAAGAVPWLSPTGMILNVDKLYPKEDGEFPKSADPLNRNPMHFSFLLSTSDHFKGTHDQVFGFQGASYGLSPFYQATSGEVNLEETRVITDPRVFQSYAMPYHDDEPLLRPENLPPVVERVRGLRLTFTVKPKFSKRSWSVSTWVWKRTYHLLKGWEELRQFDYIYRSVLKN